MKKYSFFLLVLFCKNAFAQKGLDEMIRAEKSFASYSVLHGTKDAFLQFADSASVMFSQGNPVNGYQLWANREKRPGVLNWRPRYAEVSASGDFGYTCGPWTFQPQSATDPVAANGYFFTIWQKNQRGEWKFILDVGIDHGPMLSDTGVVVQTVPTQRGVATSMLEAESDFIRLYKMDSVKAYSRFLSSQSLTAREGAGFENRKLTSSSGNNEGSIVFSTLGNGLASGGDLGYVYGTATVNGKTEAYLRIWRNEINGWKIALQLLRL